MEAIITFFLAFLPIGYFKTFIILVFIGIALIFFAIWVMEDSANPLIAGIKKWIKRFFWVALGFAILVTLFSEDPEEAAVERTEKEFTDEEENFATPNSEIYYYVTNGNSYHSTPNCPSLSRSSEVFSASLDECIENGKDDPCDICINK